MYGIRYWWYSQYSQRHYEAGIKIFGAWRYTKSCSLGFARTFAVLRSRRLNVRGHILLLRIRYILLRRNFLSILRLDAQIKAHHLGDFGSDYSYAHSKHAFDTNYVRHYHK